MTKHEMKPYRKQKSWLDEKFLHQSPTAELCSYRGKIGAQLEFPNGGGPLTWVQCPHKGNISVIRENDKWYWVVEDEEQKVKKTKQQKRNKLVLERLIALSNEDSESANFLADAMNDLLDDLAMDDFFGTERQSDPRGDGREGMWTMARVEGIDDV